MSRLRAASALLLLFTPGCSLLKSGYELVTLDSAQLRERELQRVAKDWCQTIRASQVLPVYPLTEDLEVGDMFLVTRTVNEQDKEWEERGYLSFDRHVGRLQALDYAGFYGGTWGIGTNTNTPHHWQFPKSPHDQSSLTDWAMAPGAFFPSYTFSVSKGSGAQLAIPVQAVPVGMSLMSSQSATGTVLLSDARTYGLPLDQLTSRAKLWVANAEHQALLNAVRPVEKDGHRSRAWLRVVNRVYLIGAIDVSLVNTDTAALGLDAGADPPQIKLLDTAGSPDDFTKALKAVNDSLAAPAPAGESASTIPGTLPGLPGGVPAPSASVRLSQASRRSITAKETFTRPLVVGYLGFDFPITDNGELGAPSTTLSVVSQAPSVEGTSLGKFTADQIGVDVEYRSIAQRAAARPDQAEKIYQRAAALLGDDFATKYASTRAANLDKTWVGARDAFTATSGHLSMDRPKLTPLEASRLILDALQQARHDVLATEGAP
jgi:hypothetical protein